MILYPSVLYCVFPKSRDFEIINWNSGVILEPKVHIYIAPVAPALFWWWLFSPVQDPIQKHVWQLVVMSLWSLVIQEHSFVFPCLSCFWQLWKVQANYFIGVFVFYFVWDSLVTQFESLILGQKHHKCDIVSSSVYLIRRHGANWSHCWWCESSVQLLCPPV